MKRLTTTAFLVIGMAVCLLLAGGVSYFASEQPDGLEWAAEQLGILESVEQTPPVHDSAPMPDYSTPGVKEGSHLSTAIAGITGTLIMLALGCGLALFLRRPRNHHGDHESLSNHLNSAGAPR